VAGRGHVGDTKTPLRSCFERWRGLVADTGHARFRAMEGAYGHLLHPIRSKNQANNNTREILYAMSRQKKEKNNKVGAPFAPTVPSPCSC
jgi:hypothetical protein